MNEYEYDEKYHINKSQKIPDSYCDNFASFANKLPNISYTDKMTLFSNLQSSAPSGPVELMKFTTPMLKENFTIVKEKG